MAQVPQVDYRANPSFVGDVEQGVDSYENPNAAPAVFVALPAPPDSVDNPTDGPPTIPGYVQEGLGLDVPDRVVDSWARTNPDVASKGYTSW